MKTKNDILKDIENLVATEENLATLLVKLYDLNFAYNRLLEIEGYNICDTISITRNKNGV